MKSSRAIKPTDQPSGNIPTGTSLVDVLDYPFYLIKPGHPRVNPIPVSSLQDWCFPHRAVLKYERKKIVRKELDKMLNLKNGFFLFRHVGPQELHLTDRENIIGSIAGKFWGYFPIEVKKQWHASLRALQRKHSPAQSKPQTTPASRPQWRAVPKASSGDAPSPSPASTSTHPHVSAVTTATPLSEPQPPFPHYPVMSPLIGLVTLNHHMNTSPASYRPIQFPANPTRPSPIAASLPRNHDYIPSNLGPSRAMSSRKKKSTPSSSQVVLPQRYMTGSVESSPARTPTLPPRLELNYPNFTSTPSFDNTSLYSPALTTSSASFSTPSSNLSTPPSNLSIHQIPEQLYFYSAMGDKNSDDHSSGNSFQEMSTDSTALGLDFAHDSNPLAFPSSPPYNVNFDLSPNLNPIISTYPDSNSNVIPDQYSFQDGTFTTAEHYTPQIPNNQPLPVVEGFSVSSIETSAYTNNTYEYPMMDPQPQYPTDYNPPFIFNTDTSQQLMSPLAFS